MSAMICCVSDRVMSMHLIYPLQGERTPLHMAAENNSFAVAELLIRSGADVNAKEIIVSTATILIFIIR